MVDNLKLKSGILCECGRWSHRAIRSVVVLGAPAGAVSLQVDERQCPKCRAWFLLVFRVCDEPPAVSSWLVPIQDADEMGLRDALGSVDGLSGDDVTRIVEVARRMSQARAA